MDIVLCCLVPGVGEHVIEAVLVLGPVLDQAEILRVRQQGHVARQQPHGLGAAPPQSISVPTVVVTEKPQFLSSQPSGC